MPEVRGLSAAFAESHPLDAARVLEALSAEDTAAFVDALAPRVAAAQRASDLARELRKGYDLGR